ncbi:transcription elongation factor GreA [Mycoplasmopsis pullorum]|uniref:Transcription elongation factor GreA n=1 Tax=Mycoplasmopsis pullorum TaxID=48003 RepID=A0A1L4FSE4_9BACT|nr:transcription elongation factor GreA [Mycoplasmopsis pullorum]APJ38530.1 transcription elongation factor GreA [Mycoplasmopsis pullorum]TNK83412.1 transcription elongation factor GreA [Mycoplasmopsis pullorum]TNK85067.1 transcription elongation factor GreA [Mycoplasmopsis pullorum]TNK85641.1 transcription elongation factor GreA [Mycoplasmopsis pullorum]TNK86131.1 transcription elongation factor GreA [Mycoplasmopsis pullorum]
MARKNISENKIFLASETLEKYKKEYEHLVNVERPAVQEALKEARAQGDLSENAEYDAARERQSVVEGRIAELESIIDRAVLIEETNSREKVGIGSTVTFKNDKTNEISTVTIMGSHDANPFENKISNESPLAEAMLGSSRGDIVEVEAPTKYTIEILDIEFK